MSAKWTKVVVVIRKEVALGATAHLDTVERNAPVSLDNIHYVVLPSKFYQEYIISDIYSWFYLHACWQR